MAFIFSFLFHEVEQKIVGFQLLIQLMRREVPQKFPKSRKPWNWEEMK